MSKELRIRRNNVELSFHFETVEELTKQLQNNNEIWQVIEGNLDISFLEKKTIREDLIDICELDGSLIVLKKSPASPLHKVILTLYAYGPNGATVDQISRTTGIEKPSNQILTPGKNKKYFRKLENKKWYLSERIGDYSKNHKRIKKIEHESSPDKDRIWRVSYRIYR